LWEENEVPCTTNDDIQQPEPGRTILLKDTIVYRKCVMYDAFIILLHKTYKSSYFKMRLDYIVAGTDSFE